MTLVNARAAFEKAVTDAVVAADNTVLMKYDNVAFTTPGKTKKYILMTVNFGQATLQNQGAAQVLKVTVEFAKKKKLSSCIAVIRMSKAFTFCAPTFFFVSVHFIPLGPWSFPFG